MELEFAKQLHVRLHDTITELVEAGGEPYMVLELGRLADRIELILDGGAHYRNTATAAGTMWMADLAWADAHNWLESNRRRQVRQAASEGRAG